MDSEARKRGRPRVWESAHERKREHRQRKAEVYRATGELILAVLNAELEDPQLKEQINAARDDLTVLQALTAYYRARPWQGRIGKA
jgi:hypothetical protein